MCTDERFEKPLSEFKLPRSSSSSNDESIHVLDLGKELEGTTYFHPLNETKLPFLAARHVTMNLGTGLVHTAPAHGQEDFVVAIENNIPVVS